MPKKTAPKRTPADPNVRITKYFKKGNQVAIDSDNPTEVYPIIQFYNVAVVSQIESCEITACVDTKSELKKKIETATLELEKIKKACAIATSICTEKDHEIENLKQRITKPTSNEFIGNARPVEQPKTDDFSFGHFTEQQLEAIRQIGDSFSNDSTFVSNILRFLYADDVDKLPNLSVTGRSNKGKICAEKLNIITKMFSLRLQKQLNEKSEIDTRMSRLNKLLNSAITNAAILLPIKTKLKV